VGPDADSVYAYGRSNFLWALVLSSSWLISALSGPFFGALSDRWGKRKTLLALSVVVCALSTASLYFAQPRQIILTATLVIVSNLAYALSENFISAFLPHITTASNIGKISGLAWGIGYFGGLASIIVCAAATGFRYTLDNFERLRLLGPITAIFFIGGSIPTFLFVREPRVSRAATTLGTAIRSAYSELHQTLLNLRQFRDLALFLLASFFFQGGLSIVISFAAVYGEQVVGISGGWQAAFFISLQITAAFGAFFCGWIEHRVGALRCINVTLLIWISTILMIFYLQDFCRIFHIEDIRLPFLVIGNCAGLCLGATQSSARTLVGIFSPPEKSGEFFGFWGFSGKLAAVFATFAFGALQALFSLQGALLFCVLFFAIGFFINQAVREPSR